MKTDIQNDEDKKRQGGVSPSKLESAKQELVSAAEQHALDIGDKNSQIESLQERINELELHEKLQANDVEREIREVRSQFSEMEQAKLSLQEKVRNVEISKVKIIEESDRKYKEAVTLFEDEMEQKEQTLQ